MLIIVGPWSGTWQAERHTAKKGCGPRLSIDYTDHPVIQQETGQTVIKPEIGWMTETAPLDRCLTQAEAEHQRSVDSL